MKGWKTRTFTGKVSQHHRKVGTAERGPIKANFYTGIMDYAMGNHLLWQLFRTAYQTTKKPIAIRGLALGAGFLWAFLRHAERPVSREFIAFHRREQMERLKNKLARKRWPGDNAALPRGEAHEAH
jgi:hypothetical protein